MGDEMVQAVNLAGQCNSGYLPKSGGLLDQSAWFIDLWQTLASDQNAIQAEQMKKRYGH